ncbi:ABC transporter substrate-binding protein [Cohaesibacter marisflavi]|uniref:ABC transporter substrate-binding protein n=1 Tax=Cohaesibacter marisflavi TaxID=655353 RepID=UPI0029C65D22|nr:ABC transporter substrate-binding protein [Cohaesibacter marisflavi]
MKLSKSLSFIRPVVTALAVTLSLGVSHNAMAQSKDVLVVAVPGDIQNLDPTLSGGDIPTQEFLTNVYDWLIDYKMIENADGTLSADPSGFVGGLAESYDWSEDGKTITFKLRKGLKFSNGDPLNAEAVKFTYDRIFDQKGVAASLMGMASVKKKEQIKVIDPLTVALTVEKPNTLLLGNMAQFPHSILNPKVVKPHMTKEDPYAHEWLKTHVQGTEQGAFKLANWTPGDSWVLERNENYWGTPAKLSKVIFKIIPDPSSRLAQLVSGAVDVAYNLPTSDIKALEENPDITVNRDTNRTVTYIGLNNKVKPFDNKLVRQAISYAFPYDTIIDQVMNGYATQLTSPIPEGTPPHTDEFFKYKNDPAKAKELLKEAGYPNGFSTTLQIPSGLQEAKEMAIYAQQTLGMAGIKINIQEMPSAAFTENLQKHTLGMFFASGWTSINNDPFYHLFWLFQSKCCNYANYDNPELANLIEKYTLNTDIEARNKAAVEAQKMIVEDAPWVFLYQPQNLVATRANVKGYTFFSADRYNRFQYMYKE